MTNNSRIRLKRDAVPSIFTVTSARKSVEKRIKIFDITNENNCKIEYSSMYVENDREHSSTGYLREKEILHNILIIYLYSCLYISK